ncbi:MAG: NADH-quinone oxidoreductase subunit J [Cephaloticoccus sp.]|nr:NADH-quinone oxidoreductase subunit J [Cephaloticoccus sp.]MCF7760701.1 NADH-quinone oxidoreductase subunit J [Cephaloticoccus sp.]
MADTLFYFLATFTVIFAVGAVLNRNVVNAALCFLLCLVGVSGLFALLEAYLLAVLLVLVYAGAVVALFLFIIMLLDMQHPSALSTKGLSAFSGVIAFGLLVTGVISFAQHGKLQTPELGDVPAVGASLKEYAYQLFTTYLLPVQVVGFLLLIAMLGVIVLSKKFDGMEDAK